MTDPSTLATRLESILERELRSAGRVAAVENEQHLRSLCAPDPGSSGSDHLDDAADWLSEQPLETIREIIQNLTMRFHLRNKSEQLAIAEINRDRERRATAEAPRAESIAEAVCTLHGSGADADSTLATLAKLDIQPTLTAHPTEARRRAILRKQAAIASLVERGEDPRLTPNELETIETSLHRVLLELAVTDEVRSERLDAMDEVRNGIHFLTGSIWDTVPTLYADFIRAMKSYYGTIGTELPTFIRYRTWIGGDRDGNPKVTADVTREALDIQRRAAIAKYLDEVDHLRQSLSVSTRRHAAAEPLLNAIDRDPVLDSDSVRHMRLEPYRVRLLQIAEHLRLAVDNPGAYSAREFLQDLRLIQDALVDGGLARLATSGPLPDLLIRVRTFGFHLAAMDIRQHSELHEAAVAEILLLAGVCEDYTALGEQDRLALLRQELASPRPLVPLGATLSENAARVLDPLHVVAQAIEQEPDSIGTLIVSMTHDASDMLEVLLLAKEAGLFAPAAPGRPARHLIDIAPLFETIDDLRRAAPLLRDLYSDPVYRAHLEHRGNMQEVMLGYSDSNKDGGYWVANWLLHQSQREISRASADAGITVRLFHGRGGTVGRGGGRANHAILAAPRESRTGRIRFTEQGEVISFRYALPAIAHRHLEQIVHAMILATHSRPDDRPESPPGSDAVMSHIAETSLTKYRSLIDDPEFWPWYSTTTPVSFISHLPLASRPVMRSPGTADFSRLRAIPWGFAWTQIRAGVPGWFGLGTAFETALQAGQTDAATLHQWFESWPFFRAVVANAEQELARARLPIALRYAAAAGFDTESGIAGQLLDEYQRTASLIKQITGSDDLLSGRPVIQQLIRSRNPDTDALNLCQIELMQRARRGNPDDPALRATMLASLNAIAAAMQSTG